MSNVGQIERETQNRVVKLFENELEYIYLGNWNDRFNSNIEDEYLVKFLKKQGYSKELIDRSIREIRMVSDNQQKSLYDVNKEVYSLIRYGAKIRLNVGEKKQSVNYIDWSNPLNNDFYIAEEVTVKGSNNKRPDIVVYINGIALGIIELKRSTVSVSQGIRQNLDNQKDNFIKPFFSTIGLVCAGNNTEGLKYGVIETTEKYYLSWKEDEKVKDRLSLNIRKRCDKQELKLDKNVIGMFDKNRIIEILYSFIIYDSGVKKICRPNQYFAVVESQRYIKRREGGIIWHTQGSGKSLTMVWLTKWIKENVHDARVLIITDREELDDQIEKVYTGVSETIYRTVSGHDLIMKLNSTTPILLCSLVHKFGNKSGDVSDKDYDHFIDEIKNNLPSNFKAKGNIHVFVDECHRTQSGKLHAAMQAILPDALFIGFTGTPLMKKDKALSLEVFGNYIHTYKYDEAVKDKVVLDLRYEAKDIEQNITSQKKIDEWFEAKTSGLTDSAKAQLKKRWGTMQKVFSSKSRLERIANDIVFDMEIKDRLKSGRGNAMLVASSIYQACKYYEIFQNSLLKKCATITSYIPTIADIKGESVGLDEDTELIEQYDTYMKMLGGKSVQEFEKEVKEKFIKDPGQMKLLIVVDKLLTGFDAPSATYLYIDKSMRDHGLFQAICRVNRLDGEDKEYGYIIDYKDLFKSLEKAVEDYTIEAFDSYEKEDVVGLVKSRIEEGKDKLEELLESLFSLCEPVESPKGSLQYIRYFCGENVEDLEELKMNEAKRVVLYKVTSSLVRAFAEISGEMISAGYTHKKAEKIRIEVLNYKKIKDEIKLASGDYIDLKKYEPDMRHLIDTYIDAKESKSLLALDDFSLIQLIIEKGTAFVSELPQNIQKDKGAVAEVIENNVRRKIVEKKSTNPKYFEKMSALLNKLIEQRKKDIIDYEKYLNRIVELTKNVNDPESSSFYPNTIKKSPALRALYDNYAQNEDLVLEIDETVKKYKQDSFRGDPAKERKIMRGLRPIVGEDDIEKVFEIITGQGEY